MLRDGCVLGRTFVRELGRITDQVVQNLDETRLIALDLRKMAAHVVEQLARREGNTFNKRVSEAG
jgi:hypothetical protein